MHGLTHSLKFAATTAALFLFGGIPSGGAGAQEGAIRQPLYLPDPTPRPPDLEKIYEQTPQQKAREQEIKRIKNAQRNQLITMDTERIALLAAELRESLKQGVADNHPAMNAQKVAEIQKLAKAIKDLEKLQ